MIYDNWIEVEKNCRKKFSTNNVAAETFKADFNKFLNNEEYELTNVYDADETGLRYYHRIVSFSLWKIRTLSQS